MNLIFKIINIFYFFLYNFCCSSEKGLAGISGAKGNSRFILLPKGNYEMTLSYPGYKILDKNLKLQDTIDVTLEASDELSKMLIVMVPEEDFQKE